MNPFTALKNLSPFHFNFFKRYWFCIVLYVERNFFRMPVCLATSHCGCACQSSVLQRCHFWWNKKDWRSFSPSGNLHSAAASWQIYLIWECGGGGGRLTPLTFRASFSPHSIFCMFHNVLPINSWSYPNLL